MLPPWQGEQHWGVLTVPVLTHKGQMSLMATALLSPCDQKGALVPLKTRSKVSYLDSVFFPYVFTKKQRGLVVHCLVERALTRNAQCVWLRKGFPEVGTMERGAETFCEALRKIRSFC